jgi:2-polyprenyl-3-methyl-5-hydroxy-6-metoxy-1,4-benzoquinol methylase
MISASHNRVSVVAGKLIPESRQATRIMSDSRENGLQVRLLVAIASYGDKNVVFLKEIIQRYQRMPMSVDVVVFSNAPKDLGNTVEVVVGLPSKDPWSLPFAHKASFARNVERYDLFIYSEDDIAVTEENIRAFLEITPQLGSDEIAGYLRYELNEDGSKSLPDFHGPFHWKPKSVRGNETRMVAEFSNEHTGFYILTQTQLRKAIASGGFLAEPREGRYGMLETAATDPYTTCGFRKVICISRIDDFLVHHMSNRYAGQFGLQYSSFEQQIKTLKSIGLKSHPAVSLCETESRLQRGVWSKNYYEKPCAEVLKMVPHDARTILSVGCGGGAIENELKRRGSRITVFPLDSVVGVVHAGLGFEVVYGTMGECFNRLGDRKFDCVLMTDLLYLLPDPWQVLDRCGQHVVPSGTLVVSGPNFRAPRVLYKRVLKIGDYQKLSDHAQSGIRALSSSAVVRQLKAAGWQAVTTHKFDRTPPRKMAGLQRWLGRFGAQHWVLSARRSHQAG